MLSPNGVRAILFDLDGTLRHSRPTFNKAFFDYAVRLGLEDDERKRQVATRWLHRYWAQSPELLGDLQNFGDRQDLFWTNHARLDLMAYGCSEDQVTELAPQVNQLMTQDYKPDDWVPADVPQTLRYLKESGFSLGVVSNRTHAYQELLETLELAGYFSVVLAAGEINSWKPEPGIFQHALKQLEIQPDQAIYVGDNYYADVIGAQAAGLRPVLIDPDGSFPEASCAVIQVIGGLTSLLEKLPDHNSDQRSNS